MSMEIALHRCPPWSELPKDLLHVIHTKLRDIFDFVRFRCVCKSWMSAGGRSYPFTGKQLPWLMLPYDPQTINRSFYSFSTRSVHVLRLPEARDHITLFSGNGWLLLLDRSSSNLSLLHPLTRHIIPIPPPPSHIDLPLGDDYYSYHCKDGVVAFEFGGDHLVYWKADEGWSQVHLGKQRWIRDIAYHKGQLYFTTFDGLFSVCLPRDGAVGRVAWSLALPAPLCCSYLVSYGEDLLFLDCTKDRCISFFRLEESAANAMQWSNISRPCDFSLFVAAPQHAFVNTSGDGSHNIYFTRDLITRERSLLVRKCKMMVMEDGVWKGGFDICKTFPNGVLRKFVLLTPTLFPAEGTNHL